MGLLLELLGLLGALLEGPPRKHERAHAVRGPSARRRAASTLGLTSDAGTLSGRIDGIRVSAARQGSYTLCVASFDAPLNLGLSIVKRSSLLGDPARRMSLDAELLAHPRGVRAREPVAVRVRARRQARPLGLAALASGRKNW